MDIRECWNFDDTFKFLELLEPSWETHEFCWWSRQGEDGYPEQKYGVPERALPRLRDLNADGWNIYVLINAIEPPSIDERGRARRLIADVSRCRALFADFDKAELPEPRWDPPPSMRVETSPGKYHAYWLIDGAIPLGEFSARQKGIAAKYGSDPTSADLNRVLRVPGFAHVKDVANPHPVRLLDASGRRYPLDLFPRRVEAPWKTGGARSAWDGVIPADNALAYRIVRDSYPEAKPGVFHVECPWGVHDEGSKSSTTYFAPSAENGGLGGFKCQHQKCAGRGIASYVREILRAARGG